MESPHADQPRFEAQPLVTDYERVLRSTRGLSDATIRNYIADLAPFLQYLGEQGCPLGADAKELRGFIHRNGDTNVSREYRSLVRDYVAWLLERRTVESGRGAGSRGHSRASVHRMLASLRSFMRFLIERRLLPDAPLWRPRSTLMGRLTPKLERRLPDLVSVSEAARLVEAPSRAGDPGSSLRDAALLELLYGCGLRVSEAASLDRDNVSLEDGTVRIWGKGSKERQTPLGSKARNALRAYLNAQDGPRDRTGPLFRNTRGERLGARSIQRIVRDYAKRSGLREDLHPHTLRHSYATHLLNGGADLRIVQELLGHSTPSATQVYTHVSQQEARRVYLAAHPLAQAPAAEHQDSE
ncbi:MAG: tyrosine-type recombinase/integrase [Chloroflexota bacterium]|nr:tyrosine-type recombinase/integrase [Chloroflexota bacterium]MDE2886491.1 tyrosine-type recombinase/integrase [Chloroflexota bacterium]